MDEFDDVLSPVEVDEERESYAEALDDDYLEEVEAFHAEREAVEDTVAYLEERYRHWKDRLQFQDTPEDAYEAALSTIEPTVELLDEEEKLPENPEAAYFFAYDTRFEPIDGIFLSAVADVTDAPVTLTNVDEVAFIGYRNSGTIEVEGGAGPCLGYENTGTIAVEGDTGPFAATDMNGGEITIGGDAGAYLAQDMTGGSVQVAGDAGKRAGHRMAGGTLGITGDTGPFLGQDATGGEVTVRGDADVSARAPDDLLTGTGQRSGRLRAVVDRGWERVDAYLDAETGIVERTKDRVAAYLSDPDTGTFRTGLVFGSLWWTQVPSMAYDVSKAMYNTARGDHTFPETSLHSKYDRVGIDSKTEGAVYLGGMVTGFAISAVMDTGIKAVLGGQQVPDINSEWLSHDTMILAGLAIDGADAVERTARRAIPRIDPAYEQPSSPEALYTEIHDKP